MALQLDPDVEQRVLACVASGEFATESEVVREALDTLEKRRAGLRDLRAMVREADQDIVAGRIGPFDAEATKAAVRKRLAELGITE